MVDSDDVTVFHPNIENSSEFDRYVHLAQENLYRGHSLPIPGGFIVLYLVTEIFRGKRLPVEICISLKGVAE